MSNFTDVAKLNSTFNVPTTDLTDFDWEVVKHQLKIIQSEYNEFLKAIDEHDYTELKDGIGDILVTVYGMAHRIGIDADKLMSNISESNFSKLCKTIEEANDTLQYYADNGVECYIQECQLDGKVVYAVKSAKDQVVMFKGEEKDFIKDKFLKSIYWKTPDLNVEF
jgi:NTP pyrophosphatase (non-canonical NTP hydrolase)